MLQPSQLSFVKLSEQLERRSLCSDSGSPVKPAIHKGVIELMSDDCLIVGKFMAMAEATVRNKPKRKNILNT